MGGSGGLFKLGSCGLVRMQVSAAGKFEVQFNDTVLLIGTDVGVGVMTKVTTPLQVNVALLVRLPGTVALMFEVPCCMQVASPVVSTVATEGTLLDQVTGPGEDAG